MNYAYYRISTEMQDYMMQRNAIDDMNILIDQEFVDKKSGKDTARPAFQQMLQKLKHNDKIYVYNQDRLSRNVIDTYIMMTKFNELNIGVFTPNGEIKFNTPHHRMIVTIVSSVKQYEREINNQRQRDGIAAYKKKHQRWGRKKVMTPTKIKQLKQLQKLNLNKTSIAKLLNVSRSSLYRYLENIDS